jgi:hypothetical protein
MPHQFEQMKAPEHGDRLLNELHKIRPNIFLVMTRSKNKNVVVYEANIRNGQFDSKNPVVGYWLILEPSYRKIRRKKMIKHDFERFNMFENQFVWGFSIPSIGIDRKSLSFKFKADKHAFYLKVTTCGKKARLYTKFNNATYLLRSGFASATENFTLNLKDNLKQLKFKGINLKTKTNETFVYT